MKRQDLINLITKKYIPNEAEDWDYIGLQISGKEEINKITFLLDLTIDSLYKIIEKEIDFVVLHHPLLFGDKEELLSNNPLLKAKVELLEKYNINILVTHTNADNGNNSIAKWQINNLDINNIERLGKGVFIADLNNEENISTIIDSLRKNLNLNYSFRTSVKTNKKVDKILLCSGSCGDIVYHNECIKRLVVVGEMKHHQWVHAKELNLDILEIGHFSEMVSFKENTKGLFLEDLENNSVKYIEIKEHDIYS